MDPFAFYFKINLIFSDGDFISICICYFLPLSSHRVQLHASCGPLKKIGSKDPDGATSVDRKGLPKEYLASLIPRFGTSVVYFPGGRTFCKKTPQFHPPPMTTPTFLSLPKMPQKCTSERGAKRGSRKEHMAGSVPSSCAYSSTSMSSLGAQTWGGGTLGGCKLWGGGTRPVSFPLINYE